MEREIRKAIEGVLVKLGIESVDFAVEHPADVAHGDYATNVAMKAMGPILHGSFKNAFGEIDSMTVGQSQPSKFSSPRQLAEEIKNALLQANIPNVAAIEIAGPGFINFRLSRDFFSEKIAHILANPDTWGRNDSWKGKKVLVEYTDPNPFKEIHVGHLFTNTVGESIARLFMMNGADTKRICYQGDVGLHVAHAIYGMTQLGLTVETGFTARDLGRAYAFGATAYKESEVVQEEIRTLNKKIYERSDESLNALYDMGRKVSLDYFETIYAHIDTQFDGYFFESEAGPRGKALVLENPDIFVESDGAHIFEGEKYGLHTRVFLNKEGLPTYEAKELALAKMKDERFGGYDWSVVATANEISEYFKVLKKAMSFVYPELEAKTEHVGHGMVKLATGKMSSRTGNVIPAIEFIEEVADTAMAKMDEGGKVVANDQLAVDVAVGAIKYATLRGNIKQDTIFDKEKALSFEGDSGPYLQYTHARIGSVLEKALSANVVPSTAHMPDLPYAVEKIVYRFEEVVRQALAERAPHKVTTYLTELAGAFNSFYAEEKIADAGDAYAPYKAALAEAVRLTLKNGLWALGIKAPSSM